MRRSEMRVLNWITALLLLAGAARAEFAADPLGQVEPLPERWPAHWVLVHDIAFEHIMDGKTVVLDLDAETPAGQFKGMFNSAFAAFLAQSRTRPEIYLAETYYSRGTRGERTDVLTIYDKRSLSPTGEVVLKTNRAILLPQKFSMQMTSDDTLALIYNFTPAMSVSVVDPIAKRYVADIPIPGCAAVFPTGQRSFSSLCGNGTLYTVRLDADGQPAGTSRSERFFDPESDALIEKAAWHAGRAWFPSYHGRWQPVDFSGDAPRIEPAWSMLDDETAGWRPGGLAPAAAGADGRLYVLAHPEGREGSHRDPGVEVWVFDPSARQRIARYPLRLPGLTLALTRDAELLLVINVEMQLDVYRASDGELLKTIAGIGTETPLLVFGAN